MTIKPFTNKPEEKVQCMAEAAAHVRQAIKILEQAKKCAEHWADYETLEHFRLQLEQFTSCDNGEAGFEPFMVKESEKVFTDKDNPIKLAIKLSRKHRRLNSQGKAVRIVVPED